MQRINSRANYYQKLVSLPNLSFQQSKSKHIILGCPFNGSYQEPIQIPKLSNMSLQYDYQLEDSIDLDTEMDMRLTSREVKIIRVARLIKASIHESKHIVGKIEEIVVKLKEVDSFMIKLFKGAKLIYDNMGNQ